MQALNFSWANGIVLSRLTQITPTLEILNTFLTTQLHRKSNQKTASPPPPPAETWRGTVRKHPPLLHKSQSTFVQLKQCLSCLVGLTYWSDERVMFCGVLERLSWTACLQRHHLKAIHWVDFLTLYALLFKGGTNLTENQNELRLSTTALLEEREPCVESTSFFMMLNSTKVGSNELESYMVVVHLFMVKINVTNSYMK